MQRRFTRVFLLLILPVLYGPVGVTAANASAVEFCLDGEFDIGARLQGHSVAPGELYPTRFCVVSETETPRVLFTAEGKANADMDGGWSVAYLPPDLVRLVNRDAPPDIEFNGASMIEEGLRHRRIDPARLVAELQANPAWTVAESDDGWRTVRYPGSRFDMDLHIEDGRLLELRSVADLPLRGRVPVVWNWSWPTGSGPSLALSVDGAVMFNARSSRRTLGADEAAALWQISGDEDPVQVPGEYWPARINMQIEELAPAVHLVTSVRTGFHHLVVETREGLVVADALAGWVELHQIPPEDLVPGMGISGLTERFVDFLEASFPESDVRAVALTHAHDDHAGGARAFAAVGARVYAPAGVASYLEEALNRDAMPEDRLSVTGATTTILPVKKRVVLADYAAPVELVELGSSPHVAHALGVYLPEQGFFYQSDLHVPNDERNVPRADRAATECWFAAWAVSKLPEDTIVLNSHSLIRTPVSRLARYLDSETCRRQ